MPACWPVMTTRVADWASRSAAATACGGACRRVSCATRARDNVSGCRGVAWDRAMVSRHASGVAGSPAKKAPTRA